MHNVVRYALAFAHGPTVLFDLATGRHLSAGLETVSDVRASIPFDYMLVAGNAEAMAGRWAAQIHETLREHGCSADILAADRADTLMIGSLEKLGLRVADGKSILEHARAIKSAEEIKAFRMSLATCEQAVRSLYEFAVPGVKESEAFGHLVGQSLARGGEYPETRLLTAGPRTNPWFQETSDRVLRTGELLSFDTDLIGPMGFYNDISRSWVIGGRRPAPAQDTLLDVSREQIAPTSTCCAPVCRSWSTHRRHTTCPTPASPTVTPIWSTAAGWASSIPSSSTPRTQPTDVRRPLRSEHGRLRGELRGRVARTGRRQAGAAGTDHGPRPGGIGASSRSMRWIFEWRELVSVRKKSPGAVEIRSRAGPFGSQAARPRPWSARGFGDVSQERARNSAASARTPIPSTLSETG